MSEPQATKLKNGEAIGIKIEVCQHAKCHRCWRHLPECGKIYKWPDLCWRCADAMDSMEETHPELYQEWLVKMENHPMRLCADSHPEIKRLLSKSGRILEVWFPKEMMTWAIFTEDNGD